LKLTTAPEKPIKLRLRFLHFFLFPGCGLRFPPRVTMATRTGILAGGNWIVDAVKLIDTWPQQDALANIVSTSRGTGGSPFNVLVDLAILGVPFPLSALGLVGDDENGRWILQQCAGHGIDTAALQKTTQAPTSYTDVMTVQSTGRRTFFH